jgi:hypothetical protein
MPGDRVSQLSPATWFPLSTNTQSPSKQTPFDLQHYQSLIRARGDTIRSVLRHMKPLLKLSTALDPGAGVGFFS